jgi:hypothetical protein
MTNSYDPFYHSYDPFDYSEPIDYSQPIAKSLERLQSETERTALTEILGELDKKTYSEIVTLKLSPDVCQEIACRSVSTDTAKQYISAYYDMRIAEDNHDTALRNAAASERSSFVAVVNATVSLLALAVSVLGFRRARRTANSAPPA